MKVLITGGRDFDDLVLLAETLNRLYGESALNWTFLCIRWGVTSTHRWHLILNTQFAQFPMTIWNAGA